MSEIPQPPPESENPREGSQRYPTEAELRAFEEYRDANLGDEELSYYPHLDTTFESFFGYPDPREHANADEDQAEPGQQPQ